MRAWLCTYFYKYRNRGNSHEKAHCSDAQLRYDAEPGLKILDTAYAQEDYAIGVAKGNTALLDAINSALEELQADGTLQAIVDKYITAE